METLNKVYRPSPTGVRFHGSPAKVKGIMGPYGCLSGDTEVLTPAGWIRIDSWLRAGKPMIAEYDLKTHMHHFAQPLDFIAASAPWFYRFHVKGLLDMALSPEHTVLCVDSAGFFTMSAQTASEKAPHSWIGIPCGMDGKHHVLLNREPPSIIPAVGGKKYCFTTGTGFFLAKREGHIFITGNSGKSSTCVMELYMRALQQKPYVGVRKTRFAIIRGTYPELRDTTLATWKMWVPERKPDGKPFCVINYQPPMRARLLTSLADGTTLDMEAIFLALDRPEDVSKLNSLEITGAWINEVRFVPLDIMPDLFGRTNRYPSKSEGGCTWRGVIMDTNPPEVDSDYYKLAEIERPIGYEFFRQPPGVLLVPNKDPKAPPVYVGNMGQNPAYPAAENIDNLNGGILYYTDQTSGADMEWIRVHLMGEYGTVMSGMPVYQNQYVDSVHCSGTVIEPYRGLPLIVAQDWGNTPGSVICQVSPRGQLRILDELFAENMGAHQFGRDFLLPFLHKNYNGMAYEVIADPSGKSQSQTNERTCIMEYQQLGIPTREARSNLLTPRLEAVRKLLTRMIDGQPGLLVSSKCVEVRKAFQKTYHYREISSSSGTQYSPEPVKNHPASTLSDAVQYAAMEIDSSMIDPMGFGNPNFNPAGISHARPVVKKSGKAFV